MRDFNWPSLRWERPGRGSRWSKGPGRECAWCVKAGVAIIPGARGKRVVGGWGQRGSGGPFPGLWEDLGRNPEVGRSGQILVISWESNWGFAYVLDERKSRLTPEFWPKQLWGWSRHLLRWERLIVRAEAPNWNAVECLALLGLPDSRGCLTPLPAYSWMYWEKNIWKETHQELWSCVIAFFVILLIFCEELIVL